MSVLDKIKQRQLDLGPAGWFRPDALNPPGNQILVKAGFIFQAGTAVIPTADQLTVGFPGAAGQQRYDLVYVDRNGIVQTLAGTLVPLGSPAFQGAPGWTGTNPGPQLPDDMLPVAYVQITDPVTVIIKQTAITEIVGHLRVTRDLAGFFIDKGLYSGSGITTPPTGASAVVTPAFAAETPGGSAALPGVVTTPPLNLLHLVDQKSDDIIHTATGHRIYGRLTQAAGVWTLSYFFQNATGVETAVGNIATDTTLGAGLTDIRMLGVPKVFGENDPHRPLFYSPEARNSDLVAGDIPLATTALPGKVTLAVDQQVAGGAVVPQANDSRLGRAKVKINGVVPAGGGFYRTNVNIIAPVGSFSAADNPGTDAVDITFVPPIGVPIGGVIEWLSPTLGTPPTPPTGFEFCDGGTVQTVASPIFGYQKPNRCITATAASAQKFARGANLTVPYGGKVGAGGVALVAGGVDQNPDHVHFFSGSGTASGNTNQATIDHGHGFSGSVSGSSSTATHGNPVSEVGGHTFRTCNTSNGGAEDHTHNFSFSANFGGTTGNMNQNASHGHSFGGISVGVSGNTSGANPNVNENRPVFEEIAVIIRVL